MITQSYKLNMIPDGTTVFVNVSQYDELSRTIEMSLFSGSLVYEIPVGSAVTVRGTKADNTGFEYPCTFTGNVVSFDIQPQMTIFSGLVDCELRISDNGEIIGSANFKLRVEPTPLGTGTVISDTDLPLLEEAIQASQDAKEYAKQAEQSAEDASSVLASAVKSVNNVLPDSNGNVSIAVGGLPSGGTTGQVLTKQSNADDDADWETMDLSAKMDKVSSATNGDLLTTNASGQAIDSGVTINELKCLVLTSASFSSLPQTLSNANITADHVVIESVLSNPSAQTGDWTVTTASGTATISGTISGSTTLTLYLIKQQ